MTTKRRAILSIAAALASLPYAGVDPANAATPGQAPVGEKLNQSIAGHKANVVYPAGEDLLGLIVTKQADGTVVATHSSHASHHSHHSHHSHYSSR